MNRESSESLSGVSSTWLTKAEEAEIGDRSMPCAACCHSMIKQLVLGKQSLLTIGW
jgi:hypothetical protein